MWWATAARIVQFAAVTTAAWMGWGLVGTSLLFTGLVFAANVLLLLDIYRLYPLLYPWWSGGDFRHGIRNFLHSSALTGVSILDLLSLQGVVLLVTGSLGALVVPLFTTQRTLANTAMQGAGFLLNPIQPDLVRYHMQRETAKIGAVFNFFWFVTSATINGSMVIGLFFIEAIYVFWTRGKLEFDRVLFSWLAAAVLVRTLSAPMQVYLASINQLKALVATAMTRAALTAIGVLSLTRVMGLGGVGAALLISEVLGSFLLPWLFTVRAFSNLDGKTRVRAPRLAIVSTVSSGIALAGFGMNVLIWPWLAGGALITVFVTAIFQWRELSLDVKDRALMVFQPVRSVLKSLGMAV
jgi:O-antigen/teichoic acid export membrane protein